MRALPWVSLALLVAVLPTTAAASGGQAVALQSPTALPLADVAFRGDGLALVVGGAPGQGVVLRVEDSGVSVALQDAHRYLAAAWSPAGTEALVTGDGALLRTTDGGTFASLALPEGVAAFDGRAVAWKPDGSQALVAGSALLRYWAADQRLEVVRQSSDEAWGAVAWKPDGGLALVEQAQRQAAGWVTGRLLTFDGAALSHVATYGTGQGLVEGIGWAASGAWALVWGYDAAAKQGPVMRWDGNALTTAFTKPVDRFTALAWRPGTNMALLAGSSAERIAETGGASYVALADPGADLLGAAWHPSGQHALLSGVGGVLLRWLPEGAPSVRVLAPLPGQLVAGPFEVVAQAEPRPGHALQAVEVRLDDGPWLLATPADPEGAWSLRLDAAGLGDGVHALAVRARDDGASGEAVFVGFRVAHGFGAAPRLLDLPARDDDGALAVRWTGTGAERYELQRASEPGFASPAALAQTRESAAHVLLGQGTHWLRVRGWLAGQASPWSDAASLQVTGTASPFLARSEPAQQGDAAAASGDAPGAARDDADVRGAPGFEPLAFTAAAAAALVLARRRR